MYKKSSIFLLMVCLVFSGTTFAAPKINDLLKNIDELDELKTDLTANFQMTQQKDNKGVKVIEGVYYRRDASRSFLLVMTAPETEKGNGYLKEGDNFWMYRRNTRTFQHINRDESIAGTSVSGEDFENKRMSEMYKPALDASRKEKISEARLGDTPVYRFEVTATTDDVAYPKRVYWVRKDNYLPLKMQGYSKSGVLMKTSYFLKYTEINGKYIFLKGMFVDEFEKGNRTLMDINGISLHQIPSSTFTKAYLEHLSK